MESKFQIVSDVHIEDLYRKGKTIRDVIIPCAKNIIIAGDFGRVENTSLFKQVLTEICNAFNRVIFVPGNHEYYAMNGAKIPMRRIEAFLYSLCSELKNLTILIDSTTVVDDVMIFGSTFWSYVPKQFYIPTQLYNDQGVLLDVNEYNAMHYLSINRLKETIEYAERENIKFLVVTHHAPSFEGTLAAKHIQDQHAPAKGNMKNYMYCSDNMKIVNDDTIIAWVYGHTGHNGNVGKLITNQIDKETGIKDAVFIFRQTPRIPKPLPESVLSDVLCESEKNLIE